MLASHPVYQSMPVEDRPTLDRVLTISTNDLEAQQHIMQFQLPLAVKRFDVGLVIVDSIAANFRAEHETGTASGLGERAIDIAKTGGILRKIAKEDNVVIVVTNQVSDRFDDSLVKSSSPLRSSPSAPPSSSSAPRSSMPPPSSARRGDVLTLDHQQRFFTGWGDNPSARSNNMKTPTLGLAWANQISARIALKMEGERMIYAGGNIWQDKKRRRFASVVFAPWAKPTGKPVEYEVTAAGIVSVQKEEGQTSSQAVEPELLDESLWEEPEDEEFP